MVTIAINSWPHKMLMVSFAALTALVTMAFWVGFIKLIVSFEALCRLQRLQSLHLTELGKRQAMFILMISGDYCSWGFFVNGWSRWILRFGVIRINCASGHRVTLRTLTLYIIHSGDQQGDLYIPMSEIYCLNHLGITDTDGLQENQKTHQIICDAFVTRQTQ